MWRDRKKFVGGWEKVGLMYIAVLIIRLMSYYLLETTARNSSWRQSYKAGVRYLKRSSSPCPTTFLPSQTPSTSINSSLPRPLTSLPRIERHHLRNLHLRILDSHIGLHLTHIVQRRSTHNPTRVPHPQHPLTIRFLHLGPRNQQNPPLSSCLLETVEY